MSQKNYIESFIKPFMMIRNMIQRNKQADMFEEYPLNRNYDMAVQQAMNNSSLTEIIKRFPGIELSVGENGDSIEYNLTVSPDASRLFEFAIYDAGYTPQNGIKDIVRHMIGRYRTPSQSREWNRQDGTSLYVTYK